MTLRRFSVVIPGIAESPFHVWLAALWGRELGRERKKYNHVPFYCEGDSVRNLQNVLAYGEYGIIGLRFHALTCRLASNT